MPTFHPIGQIGEGADSFAAFRLPGGCLPTAGAAARLDGGLSIGRGSGARRVSPGLIGRRPLSIERTG